MTRPAVVDQAAEAEFIAKVVSANLDPNQRWIRDCVAISWDDTRPYFPARELPAQGSRVLEFDCNVGATSITLAAMGVTVMDRADRGTAFLMAKRM